MVITLVMNPIEADKVLEDMDTSNASGYASRFLFQVLLAVADQDKARIRRINSGEEDVAAWELEEVS